MSDIQSEELGRRRFQIRKEKAVEEACERIRRARKEVWESLSSEDRDALRAILGDTWTRTDNTQWASYAFSALSEKDIEIIIGLGKQALKMTKSPDVIAKTLDDILGRSR